MNVLLDVSEFQSVGQLDQMLRNADDMIVGVYIKATEGLSYRDSLATAFAKCAASHNTRFGYYDFMSNDQTADQAAYFKNFVAGVPAAGLVPMLDCEGSYDKYADGVENWQRAYGGGRVIVYAQLSNMPFYARLALPKWVAQYDSINYYRPSLAEIATYKSQGYAAWQFTSNYMGRNQDASVLLDDSLEGLYP